MEGYQSAVLESLCNLMLVSLQTNSGCPDLIWMNSACIKSHKHPQQKKQYSVQNKTKPQPNHPTITHTPDLWFPFIKAKWMNKQGYWGGFLSHTSTIPWQRLNLCLELADSVTLNRSCGSGSLKWPTQLWSAIASTLDNFVVCNVAYISG